MSKNGSSTPDGSSRTKSFNQRAAKPRVQLRRDFSRAATPASAKPAFAKASKQEAKTLSMPTLELTPRGARTLPKKQRTRAIASVDPRKLPKVMPEKARPRLDQFNRKAMGRHSLQVAKSKERDSGHRER